MFNREQALKDMQRNLSEKRYKHSIAVAQTARELAKIHGVDQEKAYTAGLFHDFAKYMTDEKSLVYLKEMNLQDEFLLASATLAHGKIAAYILEKDYDLMDKEILSAIDKHTFGDVEMSNLDKIVYIADAIEPNRNYPSVSTLRNLAKEDLNLVCYEYLKHNFKYLLENDRKIYKKSLEMYNSIIERGIHGF